MALPLYISPCIKHGLLGHSSPDRPCRIRIEGPVAAIQNLLPDSPWELETDSPIFPQPIGLELAKIAYRYIYRKDPSPWRSDAVVVRDEHLGWVSDDSQVRLLDMYLSLTGQDLFRDIDYYGVTFDHFVPTDDTNPSVLQITLSKSEKDNNKVSAVLGCDEEKSYLYRYTVNESVEARIKKTRDDRNRETVEKWMDSLEFRPIDYLYSDGAARYGMNGCG